MNLLLFLLALVALGAGLSYLQRRRRDTALADLRTSWGKPVARPRYLERIARYHRGRVRRDGVEDVDEGTWSDLGMDDLFEHLDRTRCAPGQQYLYHLMRSPRATEDELRALDGFAEVLASDAALRERLQTETRTLGVDDALFLSSLFQEELPPRPQGWFVAPALALLAAASLALAVVSPIRGVLALGAVAMVNMGVQGAYRGRITHLVRPVALLRTLGRVAGVVAALPGFPHPDGVAEAASRIAGVGRATRFLVFERSGDDLRDLLYGYVNLVFLLDVNAYLLSIEGLRRRRTELERAWEAVGYADATAALASFRAGLPVWTRPHLGATAKTLELLGVYHPRVAGAVPNDLRVHRTGVMVTGSNMAGKTTFMRAVAVNALLARTLYTCAAQGWSAPPVRVRSFIDRADDLLGGRSYFWVEAEAIGTLLRDTALAEPHLFVLDEIFRGTNTTERVAAAAAVLRRLNAGEHLVIVSTHDLELIELLGTGWEVFHFREQVEDDELRFDYRIHPGVSSTRNALRLLELLRYPPEVVAEAERIAGS